MRAAWTDLFGEQRMQIRDRQKEHPKKRKNMRAERVARIGMFVAAALICSYIETLLPIHFGVPGIKLGLANLAVLLVLYTMGTGDALLVSLLRIVLAGFLFGNLFSILYSLAGGLLSFFVMWMLKRSGRFGCISVSVTGGISHNVGQLLLAAAIVENYHVLFYAPVLLFSGLLTGFVIGLIAQEVIGRLGRGDKKYL